MRRGALLAALLLAGCAIRGAHDADQDGVRDRDDGCATTPAGAVVDARGCPADADRDGALNGLDRCPNTPDGALTDSDGCPLDTDGDRVLDGVDQCPGSPPGTTVDAHGCAADGDGDGVPDRADRCPGTAAGAAVNATGCPLDADSDGVADVRDRCLGTAPGVRVDANGCEPPAPAPAPAPVPVLFTPERTTVTLQGVTFETGSSRLTPASYTVLDGVAAALRANPEYRIEVAGHTDNTGNATINLRLSEARAGAVRAYLANRGVAPDRMVARGYGSTMPAASNATSAGRNRNRRVELHRID